MKRKDTERIICDAPASWWQEASPLGNGRLGLMVYGTEPEERLELTELTFFSGNASRQNNQPHASEAFQTMRSLCCEERYEEAMEAARALIGVRNNYGTHLPCLSLFVRFLEKEESRVVSVEPAETELLGENGYERILDLMRGLLTIRSGKPDEERCREAFVSHPHGVGVYRILRKQAPAPLLLRLQAACDGTRYHIEGDTICFSTQAREKRHSDGTTGVKLEGRIRVRARRKGQAIPVCLQVSALGLAEDSGLLCESEDGLVVTASVEAEEYLLLFAADTDFDGSIQEEALQKRLAVDWSSYPQIRQQHEADVWERMSRVILQLEPRGGASEGEGAEVTSEEAAAVKLTERQFQLGRYLLLSSSREDSPLPAHLQGVWNDDVACQIGWTCDMHLDINTQMNYWISEAGNLSECHLPLFRWMEERLIPAGRQAAAESYGCAGWSADLVSNAWGYAAPYWARQISPCPTGGIWQASDYMEHYRFTQDTTFLREHTWPVLREAAEFFRDYLFEDEVGGLHCGPSISPENSFLLDRKGEPVTGWFSNDCTYEVLMIRELLLELSECAGVLLAGLPAVAEPERQELSLWKQRAEEILPKLPPYRILSDGTLAEWSHAYPAVDLQHRHTSHLLGLFPYAQVTPERTPQLAAACRRSMEARLHPKDGWEDTGWARSLMMLYCARLADGEAAWQHIRAMQQELTQPNGLVMHPPTRGTATNQAVYELDGNTGLSMCVCEMLVQSQTSEIVLLPALPMAWKSGLVDGICARGGVELRIEWKEHQLIRAEARTRRNTEAEKRLICFRYQNRKGQLLLTEKYRMIPGVCL